ncbi:DNA cytosine methyltransferase [uncultured Pseudacidovorax sp.]|uniref:DNA cytosine methyltransferase n=1 Tax=uncultured Pseudacidovorax sp. TaxID=679313 RepID=UPI0025EA1726|nr:DNA cytosine methyltransferase [uncultured Pseudacidovorax sp.]
MTAYYNEHNKYAAAWLRNLIAAGHIAPGVVDERSIEDVRPRDLDGFTQCHFFAGIGIWSLALRRAGWPDERPVWTGSCPCQPFSKAGKGAGFADERHLWPAFFHLISERRPPVILGEQVASKDADPWIDLVQADMESLGYPFGCVPFPAAGVGAPHIRDRNYWMAHSNRSTRGKGRSHIRGRPDRSHAESRSGLGCNGLLGGLAHDDQHRRAADAVQGLRDVEHHTQPCGGAVQLGDAERSGLALGQRLTRISGGASGADAGQAIERTGVHSTAGTGPTNGLWRDADWLLCRDGKWRPVEPGTFPLADAWPHGSRVECLRAAGNAITLGQAQTFIEAVMDSISIRQQADRIIETTKKEMCDAR